MRYIIGIEEQNKYTKEIINFLYCKGTIGISGIYSKNGTTDSTQVIVFENLEDAQFVLSTLTREYRRNDVPYYLPHRKSKTIKRWYLIKVDSLNCPIKLKKCISSEYKFFNHKMIDFKTYSFEYK